MFGNKKRREYTICIGPKKMVLSTRREPKSRLHFTGGDIDIYVTGAVGRRRDTLNYLALSVMRDNHIPLIQLTDVKARK